MSPKPDTVDGNRDTQDHAELTIRLARMEVIEQCCRIDELVAKLRPSHAA